MITVVILYSLLSPGDLTGPGRASIVEVRQPGKRSKMSESGEREVGKVRSSRNEAKMFFRINTTFGKSIKARMLFIMQGLSESRLASV